MTGVLLDAHWRKLAQLMQQPELADDPRYATTAARIARRAEVDALFAAWLAPQPIEQAIAALLGAGLPAAPVRSYAEAAADPHVRARDMLQPVAQADGSVRADHGAGREALAHADRHAQRRAVARRRRGCGPGRGGARRGGDHTRCAATG